MARPIASNSVRTLVGLLQTGMHLNIENKSTSSVAVMVSNLKKIEEHKDKKFKVSSKDSVTTVTRVL
jgi:hypothetical protein